VSVYARVRIFRDPYRTDRAATAALALIPPSTAPPDS